MIESSKAKLILFTPIFILVSHYLAVFPHEYAHSFTAWLLGFKSNPLAIDYGGSSWKNLLLLLNIDENVNYSFIFDQGKGYAAALIAFAGPGIGNGVFYVLSLLWLKNDKVKNKIYLYYFIFWFNFMNLANFYDYVPIRTFSTKGDIGHLTQGLNISPWYIYVIFGYLVILLLWHFYTRTLICAFSVLKLSATTSRAALVILCTSIMFGYFGLPGLFNYGEISYFLSATSVFAIPGIITACWPTRVWVRRQLEKEAHQY